MWRNFSTSGQQTSEPVAMAPADIGKADNPPEPGPQEGWGADLEFTFKPLDNPDWGHARNRHCVLMAASAEWSQSAVSEVTQLGAAKYFLAPVRDWTYEGLFVYSKGENWKYVDSIALAFQGIEGQFLQFRLLDAKVSASPWRVSYEYLLQIYRNGHSAGPAHRLTVGYYLHAASGPEAVSGQVEISSQDGLVWDGGSVRPVLQPFLDIRHMYRDSCPQACYAMQFNPEDVRIEAQGKAAAFFADGLVLAELDKLEERRCVYRLGSGDRMEICNAETGLQTIQFIPQERQTLAAFCFQPRFDSAARRAGILFCCGEPGEVNHRDLAALQAAHRQSQGSDRALYTRVAQAFGEAFPPGYRHAIAARIVAQTKFKIHVQDGGRPSFTLLPVAGGFWFKTPWYRDTFEGILNSFRTLSRLEGELDVVKAVIVAALQGQDLGSGRIMTRIPESLNEAPCYHNVDATLLAFLTAAEYLSVRDDKTLAALVLRHFGMLLQAFSRQTPANLPCLAPDGPPWIDPATGLLACTPSHGWIDTNAQQSNIDGVWIDDLPSRFSRRFVSEFAAKFSGPGKCRQMLRSPNFLLPDINALWLCALREMAGLADRFDLDGPERAPVRSKLAPLRAAAEAHFTSTFWNEDKGFLHNAVCVASGLRDEVECEAAVMALAFLGRWLFEPRQIAQAVACLKKTLLVKRRLLELGQGERPFGIVVKNEPSGPFYGDCQYHGDVVWPRSTPYLIKLLDYCGGHQAMIGDLLVNMLGHQMTEGAVFFAHELFSKPLGRNPSPVPSTERNPVPVKNPLQFWSQWCDAYLEHPLEPSMASQNSPTAALGVAGSGQADK